MNHPIPPLPAGFTARHGSLDDVEMAAALGREYALATTGFSDLDADSLRTMWQSPGFDPTRDVYFVISPEGKTAGYYEVWSNNEPPVHPFIWGMVAVEFHGKGIGSHMLAWAENHARRVLDRVPSDTRVAPFSACASTNAGANTLLENNGWTHIRSSYSMRIDMNAAPPTPEIPAGIIIRTFQPGDAEAVYRAVDEAFKDHFGHVDQPFESGFARFKHTRIEEPLFDGSLWYLAMAGNEIAGICLGRKEAWDDPQAGYVGSLGVRRPWRKQGLGLALLHLAFGEFYRRGYTKVSLGVDAQNITGALRLYEKAGMHIVRQYDEYEKELRPGRELRTEG